MYDSPILMIASRGERIIFFPIYVQHLDIDPFLDTITVLFVACRGTLKNEDWYVL